MLEFERSFFNENFVIANEMPFDNEAHEGVTAVNIIEYEIIERFLNLGHDIVLQVIRNPYSPHKEELSEVEEEQLLRLGKLGVQVMPFIFAKQYLEVNSSHSLKRLIQGILGLNKLVRTYPAVCLRNQLGQRVRTSEADVVLNLWCVEGVAATSNLTDVPVVAYHGDIDFVPGKMRVRDYDLFHFKRHGIVGKVSETLFKWRAKKFHRTFEEVHLKLMQDVDCIANVTASNSVYYQEHEHKKSIYVPNIWSNSRFRELPEIVAKQPGDYLKLIGHIGGLGQTGSSYGLEFLLKHVMPAPEISLAEFDYSVHIIGGGQVVPGLRDWIGHKRIVMPGFVEDIDTELISGDVFMMLNNVGPYKAAYTRHMVAWSMGLCLIAHEGSKKAIPEIEHGKNALLGSTGEEIADLVRLAVTDCELNKHIRENGRKTYEKYFTPEIVIKKLSDEMEALVHP